MLETEVDGPVTLIRLAHGKAGALDLELCQALEERLGRESASEGGALVLTGTGSIFSAGVDLFRIVEGGAAYIRAFLPALSRALETLFSLERPVVAAVNGHAIAGGCVLACAADYRLGVGDGARIGVPELGVGVPFPAAALETLRAAVPREVRRLVLTGQVLEAEGALERGLLDEVVTPETLRQRALEVAAEMAAIPPRSFALTKRQLRAPYRERMRADDGAEVVEVWSRPEVLEAIRGYVEKTLRRRESEEGAKDDST